MKTELPRIVFGLTLGFICLVCAAAGPRPTKHNTAPEASTPGAKTCPSPEESAKSVAEEPVALVAGQPIYERDIANRVASQVLQLHQQEYQIKSKALEDLIRQKLVEAEAKKRGLSVDKLYVEEVDAKVPTPSDDEVEGYYLAVKAQLNQPLQQVKPQLQNALKTLKTQQARQEYADSLRAKADVAVLLRPPKVNVTYDPARLRGDPKAPITIVEFSDFQCPYCKQTEATLKNVLSKYNGQVNVAFRDFPLGPVHPHAEMAAEAARCAGEQGKFWEFHDALFDDQSKLDEPGLNATAQKLGLDANSFQSCLTSGKYKVQVSQDEEDGKKAGVTGTPGFFVAGIFVNGAQPEAEFDKIIDAELVALKNQTSVRASH